MIHRSLLVLVALAACGLAHAAEGDPAAGKRKTVTCNACHGVSGFKSMPKLGGQTAGYVIEALRAYKTGKRSHPTMRDVAGALSERDIADLAAHYGGIPKAESASAAPVPAAAQRCVACHGAQGDLPAATEVPIIAGQSAAYIEQVVREYRDGARTHAVMQEQARGLGDAEIAELAGFFASRAALSVR